MKKEVEYHEVVIKFVVSHRDAVTAISQFPQIRAMSGRNLAAMRRKLAAVVAHGIGGNDMGALDAEEITIVIDGKEF